MLRVFKKFFIKSKDIKDNNESVHSEPARTFNKILTGKYYGLADNNADKALVSELKSKKIEQIKSLKLKPKFARFIYEKNLDDYTDAKPIGVYVAFQKEHYSRKRQMLHVSEMSFIVKAEEFKEFEERLGIDILKDFRHLEPEGSYKGEERRKKPREV